MNKWSMLWIGKDTTEARSKAISVGNNSNANIQGHYSCGSTNPISSNTFFMAKGKSGHQRRFQAKWNTLWVLLMTLPAKRKAPKR